MISKNYYMFTNLLIINYFSFSTTLMGSTVRIFSMYLYFPFTYKYIANNKFGDPFKPLLITNANSGVTNNTFNLPLYNFSDSLDYLASAGPDPGQFYQTRTYSTGTNNMQSIIY